MIRYVAKGKSAWEPVDDNPIELQQLCDSGKYEFMTVLSVSEIVDEETTDYDELKYKGPLYFDIDVEGNIEKATHSAQELVENLINHGVLESYILIYCTGSKGYHVLVHPKVFSTGRPQKHLPTIYKEVALKFAVEGLDFVVYSEKRGRMWRIPNFKRSNGKYKVSISLDELNDMTTAKYEELISNPRPDRHFPEAVAPSSQMKMLFNEAKKSRLKKLKQQMNSKGLGSEHLKQLDGIPACVEQVRAWEGLNPNEHFNQIILQTVTYMKAAELDEHEADHLIRDIAKNSSSHRFPTEQERRREITSKLGYVNRSDYKFDCSYMRSILDESPCKGCKLEHACLDGDVQEAEDGTLGIIATDKGYYRGDTQISTFTMNPKNRFLDADSGIVDLTVGMEVQVNIEGQLSGSARLTEDAFQSKSELLRQIRGFGKAVFFGTDADTQKLKHNLFNKADMSEIGDIMEVYTAGIMETRKGSRSLVYVEPEFSIDQYKTIGTHNLISDPAIPPEVREVDLPKAEDLEHITEVFRQLLTVNSPEVVGQILGWTAACHLKTHFGSGEEGAKEFPLLFLTGNAGSGKTQTSGLFLNLHCVDYLVKDSAPSLASITEWALIDTCSVTTTTPRVLDEFNRAKMGIKRYNSASEIMKMSWGSQTINRGTISKGSHSKQGRTGARTVTIPITSPLLVLGEQQPTEPALLQRSCIVPLKEAGRMGREAPFKYVMNNTEALRKVGKALVYQALRKPLKYAYALREKHSDKMPETFDPRPRITYQIILGGLDFFEETLELIGVELTKELDEVRQAVIGMLELHGERLSKSKSSTEIDSVINLLAVLALMTPEDSEHMQVRMTKGEMYLRTEKHIYLDITVCHTMYAWECRRTHTIQVVAKPNLMREMLEEEQYCISVDKPCEEDPSFANGRPVAKLDIQKMKAKGLEADYFSFGDTFTAGPTAFKPINDGEIMP